MKRNKLIKLTLVFLALSALVVFSSTPVFSAANDGSISQQPLDSPDNQPLPRDVEPEWGLTNAVSVPIYGSTFVPVRGTDATYKNYSSFTYCTGSCILNGNVAIPQGAKLYGWIFDGYDNGAGTSYLKLWRCPFDGGCYLLGSTISSSGSGYFQGYQYYSTTIDNFHNYYFFEVDLPAGSAYGIVGAIVRYQRQVNTALSNPFTDIGAYNTRFQNAIKALAASGITHGCTATQFCPGSYVTRGEIAVFLAEALGLGWPN